VVIPFQITSEQTENAVLSIACGSHRGGPGSRPGRHVGLEVDKAALGQVFSEYFGFPCQSSFHQFVHHHIHPGLAQ
jgi:hypothetical protein